MSMFLPALAQWLIPALLLTLLAYGCGSASLPVTPTPINPQVILDDCGRAMSALTSYRFRIEHNEGGGTPLAQGMTLTDANGGVESPDKLAVDFIGTAGNFAVRGSLIAIGEDVYMTNPLSGEWHTVSSELSPLNFFDPSGGIADILGQVRDAALISSDAAQYRISGTLPATALAPLFGETEAHISVDVTLTIDKAELYLTQARLEGRITPTEADGIVRTITLSAFDGPVDIAIPDGG